MLNLSTTDVGYYGKAMYFTQYPKYGEYYIEQFDGTVGRFQLILSWALLGRPWAMTKVPAPFPIQSHTLILPTGRNARPMQA